MDMGICIQNLSYMVFGVSGVRVGWGGGEWIQIIHTVVGVILNMVADLAVIKSYMISNDT